MDDKYKKAADILNWDKPIFSFYADRLDQLARQASAEDYADEKIEYNTSKQPIGGNRTAHLAFVRASRKQTVDRERERMERIIQLCERAEDNNRRDAYVQYARSRGLSEQHIGAVLNAS